MPSEIEVELDTTPTSGIQIDVEQSVGEAASGVEVELSSGAETPTSNVPDAPNEDGKIIVSEDGEWVIGTMPEPPDLLPIYEDIDAEADLRITGDQALDARIDTLVDNLLAADDALSSRIDDEVASRADTDGALDDKINDEIQDRVDAVNDEALTRFQNDNALGDRIDGVEGSLASEITDRTNADNALSDDIIAAIAQEVSDRNQAIADAIDALVDDAPDLLNTLLELAEAATNDAAAIADIVTELGTKITLAQAQALVDIESAARIAAVSAAIATASSDATTKAGAAQAAAIAAAALDATTKADAKVAQTITNGVTTSAPSQDAVYDALALKQDASTALTLGETSTTAYRADHGKLAYDHSQVTGNPHGVTKSDVGLGNVDNTSDTTKNAATATLTNKRITKRVTTIASSATPTINTDNCDAVTITALATAITSMSSGLSGTPSNFDSLIIRIKDDGTARAIAWGTSFASRGATLPTTTTLGKVTTVGFFYNSVTSTWDCVAAVTEA